MTYTIEISAKEIQERVAEMMPLEKNLVVAAIILSNPKTDLIDSTNQIGLGCDIKVTLPDNTTGAGSVFIAADLTYKRDTYSFYLLNPVLKSVVIKDLDPQFQPLVETVLQTLLTNLLNSQPVYKLKDGNLEEKLTKATLNAVEIKGKRLLVTLDI
jgi:hypothetical protein